MKKKQMIMDLFSVRFRRLQRLRVSDHGQLLEFKKIQRNSQNTLFRWSLPPTFAILSYPSSQSTEAVRKWIALCFLALRSEWMKRWKVQQCIYSANHLHFNDSIKGLYFSSHLSRLHSLHSLRCHETGCWLFFQTFFRLNCHGVTNMFHSIAKKAICSMFDVRCRCDVLKII